MVPLTTRSVAIWVTIGMDTSFGVIENGNVTIVVASGLIVPT